jgi:hypothetical protein
MCYFTWESIEEDLQPLKNIDKIERSNATQTISWVLDFISMNLDIMPLSDRWKLSVDVHKHLRLWDIASKEGDLFIDPPRFDIDSLQKELISAFDSYLKPLLTQKTSGPMPVHLGEKLPPKVLIVSEGDLFFTRILRENIDKIAVANFLDSLSSLTPIPIDRFQKCEECGRWFFPQGKGVREQRRYCSRTCNMKVSSRRQRERLKKGPKSRKAQKKG